VDIFGKDLELLRQAVPTIQRVAVLSNPAGPSQPLTVRNIKAAAQSLGLQLLLVDARGPEEFDRAFATMTKERVGALFVVTDPAYIPHRKRLIELTRKNRLPSIFTQRADVEAGGLMSYGPNFPDMYRRAAAFVDKILKGARPADMPIEQPTTFELIVNLSTARELGLTIPPSLLTRADQVIE
jgi:putative ABC transport system substrate-binding protein